MMHCESCGADFEHPAIYRERENLDGERGYYWHETLVCPFCIKASAVVTNYFPIDFKGNALCVCDVCKFYRRTAKVCGLNGEIIPWADKYVGRNCPLEKDFEED